jgi:hypothetical protein
MALKPVLPWFVNAPDTIGHVWTRRRPAPVAVWRIRAYLAF